MHCEWYDENHSCAHQDLQPQMKASTVHHDGSSSSAAECCILTDNLHVLGSSRIIGIAPAHAGGSSGWRRPLGPCGKGSYAWRGTTTPVHSSSEEQYLLSLCVYDLWRQFWADRSWLLSAATGPVQLLLPALWTVNWTLTLSLSPLKI